MLNLNDQKRIEKIRSVLIWVLFGHERVGWDRRGASFSRRAIVLLLSREVPLRVTGWDALPAVLDPARLASSTAGRNDKAVAFSRRL